MTCQYYEDLLSARLDGELTPEESAALDAHLADCPACRACAEDLERLRTDLCSLRSEPPAGLAEAVLADLAPLPKTSAKKRPPRRWVPLVCAAAVALALLGGVPLYSNLGSDAEETAAAEGADAPQEPQESGPAAGGETYPDAVADLESKTESSAPEQSPATEEMQDTEGTAVLTQDDAQAALEAYLRDQGRSLTLAPVGLDPEGEGWLFSASEPSGETAALFSVARATGQVREMPAL